MTTLGEEKMGDPVEQPSFSEYKNEDTTPLKNIEEHKIVDDETESHNLENGEKPVINLIPPEKDTNVNLDPNTEAKKDGPRDREG